MHYLYERVSYLRGLAEGMEIGDESKEGKLLLSLLDVLEDFADSVNEVHEDVSDLDSYVETMDEDLSIVEDELFGEIEEDDYFDEDYDLEEECCDEGCCCDHE